MKTKAYAAILSSALVAGAAMAADVSPEKVLFDESGAVAAPLTSAGGDAARGAAVVGSKSMGNCVACHEVGALPDVAFQGNVGPSLDGVGDRWNEAELRGLIANAKMTFDGTVMPAFYKTSGFVRAGDAYTGKAAPADLPPILSAQQIEDVVAFLATLKE